MVPITKAPLRFTPPWREEEAAPPVYLVRAATVDERTLFEAELAAPPWNAPRVSDWEILAAIEEAGRAFTDAGSPEQQRILEALAKARMGEADDADRALLAALEEQATQHWPAYAALVGARRRRATLLPVRTLRAFLIGWEHVEAPFVMGRDGRPDDATLDAIPEHEGRWLGHVIYSRLFLGEAEGKPFAVPPSSPPGPATSQAEGTPPTAAKGGKSKAKPSRKTPG